MKNEIGNNEVTEFLDRLNHPYRSEIEYLRKIVRNTDMGLDENIKWNGPNYSLNHEDRITMRIQPPIQIQLIFHRGAKVKEQPKENLINDEAKLLVWKAKDRAVATFKNMADIETNEKYLSEIIKKWIRATT